MEERERNIYGFLEILQLFRCNRSNDLILTSTGIGEQRKCDIRSTSFIGVFIFLWIFFYLFPSSNCRQTNCVVYRYKEYFLCRTKIICVEVE